jgi:hypothetical protein
MDAMTKLSLYVLALSMVAPLVPCSFGQTPTIGIFKVAFDEPAGPKEQEYARPIVLKLRHPVRVPEEFHARLFRGSVESLKKQRPDSHGCVYFSTAVFRVTVTGTIQIRPLEGAAWLRPAGDGFEPQDYAIVFESGEKPSSQKIFIHQKELDNYFQYAFSIRLLPPENLKKKVLETVNEAEEFLRRGTIPVQEENGSECWGVKTVQLADKTPADDTKIVKVAEMLPCRYESRLITAAAGGQ